MLCSANTMNDAAEENTLVQQSGAVVDLSCLHAASGAGKDSRDDKGIMCGTGDAKRLVLRNGLCITGGIRHHAQEADLVPCHVCILSTAGCFAFL